MKKHLLLSALILPAALAFTSCLDTNDNRQEQNINYGGSLCFNYVTDMQNPTAEPFVSLSPNYSFLIEYFSATMTTSMSNIRLTADGSPLTFKTPELKASNTNNGNTISCNVTDVVPEGQTQSYVFDKLNINITERTLASSTGVYKYSPIYDVRYTINNRYNVRVLPAYYDVVGKLTSTATGTTDSHEGKMSIVSLSLNPNSSAPATGKAKLEIYDVSFKADFTESRIIAEDIPYTITPSGVSIHTESGTVYKIKDVTGKEVQGAGLSDIIITVDVPSGSTSFSLHANVTGLQGEKDAVDYDLSGRLQYYYNSTSN